MNDQPETEKRLTLSKDTLVPVGAILFAVLATVTVMSKLNAIENNLATLMNRSSDRWTATHMGVWVDRVKIHNPALVMPSVQQVKADTNPQP